LVIRRIELVNFMSHVRTVIEPAQGLTVLTGPNNCGKSAVVAALQILCHNERSTYVTRHEARECSVTVETNDGHVVTWMRKNNSPRYVVDGQVFDRLEGGVPEAVTQVLRLPKVSAAAGRQFDIHFGEQKSPIFLIDESGAQAAQFFASSSDAAHFIEMQKRHRQKIADATRERAQAEAQAGKLAAEIAALAAAEPIEAELRQLESEHQRLQQEAASIRQLAHDAYALQEGAEKLRQSHDRAAALSKVSAPPELADERSLGALIERLQSAERDSHRLTAVCSATKELSAPPMMADAGELQHGLRAIRKAEAEWRRAEAIGRQLETLAPAPQLTETAEIEQAIDRLGKSAMLLAGRIADVAQADIELREAERQLRSWAQRQKSCPTCGSPLDPDQVIHHAAACGKGAGHG
jgi:DNA repair exonuclease SbcCD ATPase subunit